MPKPQAGDSASYYERYINLVEADSVSEAINKHSAAVVNFFKNIPEDKAGYRYAEGKWSLKEMLQHIIDAERVFTYRALCIARHDTTPLPGFDENEYAENSQAESRNWSDLLKEFELLRSASDMMFQSFSEEQLAQRGTSNNQTITANAIGFITFGHMLHHMNIVSERYLGAAAN